MNSETENRLVNLWQQCSFSTEEGSISYALLRAYCCALELAESELDSVFADLFEDSASVRGTAMLYELMNAGVNAAEGSEYFSSTPKMLTKRDFEAAAGIFDYSAESRAFTFSYSGTLTLQTIESISRFITNYLPVYIAVSADGGGLTFDEFESLGLFWFQLDRAALPFSVTDSLKYN